MYKFALMALALFAKFYFVEYEVSGVLARFPLSVAASAAFSILCVLAALCFPRRIRWCAALVIDFLLSALALTDVLHMRFYSDLFTLYNLGLSDQVADVAESVFALLSPCDILYFIDIPFFFIGLRRCRFEKNTVRRSAGIIFAACLCVGVIAYHINEYEHRVPRVLYMMWDRPAVCNNVGLFTYHFADCRNIVCEYLSHKKLTEAEATKIKKDYERTTAENSEQTPFYGIARGKNLIIIQVESLQNFVIGLKLNGVEITPNLNKFALNGSCSTSLFCQTGAGNSSDAEFMANTSFFPAASGVAYTRFAKNKFNALPHALKKQGYRCIALHADKESFWNRARMYPSLGFERFYSKKDYKIDKSVGLGLCDESFLKQSSVMLQREQKPFYAFLVTLSSHYPFNFPELLKMAEFDSGEYSETILGAYLSAIHYFDTCFGHFIDELKANGLYDKSVIMVYGDHTAIPKWNKESLAQLLNTDLSKEEAWKDLQRVPLIINVPGHSALHINKEFPFGQTNIPQTAAQLLGVRLETLTPSVFTQQPQPVIFRNGTHIGGGKGDNAKLEISDKILEYDLLR